MSRGLWRAGVVAGFLLLIAARAQAEPDPQYLVNRAAGHATAGRLDEAIADLDIAIRLAPDLASAYNNRGVIYEEQGKLEAAMADYDMVIRLDPKHPSAHMNRGNARQAMGDYQGAITDYERALDLKPLYPWALVNMAMARAELGQFDKALADIDHAFKLRKDPAILKARGFTQLRKGDPAAAVEDFSRAIRMLRSYADAYVGRGDAYAELKSYDLALADYEKALSEKPGSAGALNGRCWVRAIQGRELAQARADCDRALALKPDVTAILLTRSYLQLRDGATAGALADAERAFQIDPKDPHAAVLRGVARARDGRIPEAKSDLALANKLDPKVAPFYAEIGLGADLSTLATAP